MRRAIFPVVVLLAFATAGAHAQQKIDRQLPLNAMGLVKVTNLLGSIRVIGWDKDSISVSGSASAGAKFYMGGSPPGVKLGLESDQSSAGETADLVIHVPVRARLWLRTTDGDVDVRDFNGELDVGAVNSRVRVKGALKQANVETMAGDVDCTASPDYLRIRTATGRVTWTGSSDDVGILTVSGAITATGGTVIRGRFESVTGDIRFAGGTPRTGSLAFDTHSGDIALSLTKGIESEITVDAVRFDLLGTREMSGLPQDKRASTTKFIGKNGMSGATIIARSFKGKITVTQP